MFNELLKIANLIEKVRGDFSDPRDFDLCFSIHCNRFIFSVYFCSCVSRMGAVNERKQYHSFADVADRVGLPASDVQGYNQLGFEGLDRAEKQEVTIENLSVVKLPQVKKSGGSYEWSCSVSYQQDLWHQEDYGEFVLHALHNADAAIALRVKTHDLLSVRGVAWEQQVQLRSGKGKTIYHLNVTDLVIQKRAPGKPASRRQKA